MDCGPTCLRMVAKHYGRHYTAQTLREKAEISREGVSLLGIAEAAETIGFRTVGIKVPLEKLIKEVPLPCILHWGQNHFVVLHKITGSPPVFHIADPASGLVSYTATEFEQHWLSTYTIKSSLTPVKQPDEEYHALHSDDAHPLSPKERGPEGEVKREGVALLLEPTAHFYQEEGEKQAGLRIGQLLNYLWRYKSLLVQLGFGMLLGSGLQLLFPFLTQSIVDVGINTQNLPFIYLVLAAQLALMLGQAATGFIRSWILLHISVRLNLTILSEFLSKLMRLPVSFFDVKQFGDIMQRIGDHRRIESFLTGQTLTVAFSLLNLVVFGLVLAWYHLTIFVVALAASVLYAVWVVLFLKQRRKLDTRRFGIASRNQSMIVQLIQGMQDIKLAGAETLKRWEWERIQAGLFKWSVKSLSLSQFQEAGALLINEGKNIFITFLAAKAVLDGQLTLGAMLSVQYILGQFNAPISQLIGFLQGWQDAQISLERLNEVHALEDEEPADQPVRKEWPSGQDIRMEKLWYTYPGAGNEPVLRDINLLIPHGKTTAIVGTSGSGKTTLLKLLLRFYEPGKGAILLEDKIAGIPVRSISHSAWRQQCGVVMQEGFVFSDTIARNIAVCEEVIDSERLYRAARIANIHRFIESMPLGYYTRIGAEGNGISQGQKQRILIARAVYKEPQLLLFDEATNALDASNEAVILQNLQEFFRGRTVVVVAHRLSTVKHADQIVVMEKGEIVERGTHKELTARRGKYFELVSNQLELAEG